LVADGGSHSVGIHAAQVLPLLGFVPVQRAPSSATAVLDEAATRSKSPWFSDLKMVS
jgi:hypothetical protein